MRKVVLITGAARGIGAATLDSANTCVSYAASYCTGAILRVAGGR